MQIEKLGQGTALIRGAEGLFAQAGAALDFMMTVQYETGCSNLIVPYESIDAQFFILRTRIAGEVLQKFVNYHMRLAIVGDFSAFQQGSMHDFIYESNRGDTVFLVSSAEEALAKFGEDERAHADKI